jgi:hypothetical protein
MPSILWRLGAWGPLSWQSWQLYIFPHTPPYRFISDFGHKIRILIKMNSFEPLYTDIPLGIFVQNMFI